MLDVLGVGMKEKIREEEKCPHGDKAVATLLRARSFDGMTDVRRST
jgi:hypothetical protein